MPKRGKYQRRKKRERAKELNENSIERYRRYLDRQKKIKEEELREYWTHLRGLFAISFFLVRYVFERYGEENEWKDVAASILLRVQESKDVEELSKSLKHLFPHVDDELIGNAMIDENFKGIPSAERVLSLSTHSREKVDTAALKDQKKSVSPSLLFRVPKVKLCDVEKEKMPRRKCKDEYLFNGSPASALRKAKELRSHAQYLHGKMIGKFQAAANSTAAHFQSMQGYEFRKEKFRCQKEASVLIFYAHNNFYPDEIDFTDLDETEPQIDLHGLYVKEAIEYSKLVIDVAKRCRHVRRVRLLTGRGTHSGRDGPRILPAVGRYFSKSHRLHYYPDALVVQI